MLKLYHGSDNSFKEFSLDHYDTDFYNLRLNNRASLGYGIYLTKSKSLAKTYGKYIYTVMFDDSNVAQLSSDTITIQKSTLTSIILAFEKRFKIITDNWYEESIFVKRPRYYASQVAQTILDTSSSDADIFAELVNESQDLTQSTTLFNQYFDTPLGYIKNKSNIYVEDSPDVYVVFDLSTLKIKHRKENK